MFSDSWMKLLFDPRLIFAVTLVLVILLAYQLSILVWQVIPQPALAFNNSSTDRNIVAKVEKRLTTREKVNEISAQHLFGRADKEKPVQVKVQDAPKSSLNYKIRGIYYSTDNALASVILQKNANTTNYYHLGDEIDQSIYISQIEPDYVLISRRGKLEKLILEKPEAKLSAKTAARLNANLPVSSSAKVLKSYRRRYENNPMALAKRFQALPVQENGKNIGYKLKALRGESLLRKLNLQPDDVFVEINGIGLDKPFQALDALKSLTTADSVSLTVLRNGNKETMDFNLK